MSADTLIQWDQYATLWLNQLGNQALDPLCLLLSDSKIWFPCYGIVMVFAFMRLGWKKGLAVVLSLVLAVTLIDQGSNLVKAGFERLRPCYDAWMVRHGLRLPYGVTGHLFGFFSAHAANTFGFAVCSSLGFTLSDESRSYRTYTAGVFIWAALVSGSRILMGAHYLGDVLVGAVFGSAMGLVIALACRALIVKARL